MISDISDTERKMQNICISTVRLTYSSCRRNLLPFFSVAWKRKHLAAAPESQRWHSALCPVACQTQLDYGIHYICKCLRYRNSQFESICSKVSSNESAYKCTLYPVQIHFSYFRFLNELRVWWDSFRWCRHCLRNSKKRRLAYT